MDPDFGRDRWGVSGFSKGWKTEKKVERATLYLTALGVYEAHLNGKRVEIMCWRRGGRLMIKIAVSGI